jgi:hypothetical protein
VKWQAISTVLRDILSMALGTFIVVSEELSGRVHPELLTLAAGFLAGPTAIALWHTARKGGRRERRPTAGSSSRRR